MRCGKHALNNALGGEHFFTNEDLEAACDLVLFESMVPDDNGLLNPEEREDHIAENGWYSEQVLAKATLRSASISCRCVRTSSSSETRAWSAPS